MASPEHLRRRAEKRRDMKPKIADEVLSPLGITQFQPTQTENEMNIVYARSKNLKSRTKVIGSTAFKFDENGICKINLVSGRAATYTDFQILIKQNGISQHFPVSDTQSESPVEQAVVENKAPAPAPVSTPVVTATEPEIVEALASGDMTLNEVREDIGLPPIAGGDAPMPSMSVEPEPTTSPDEEVTAESWEVPSSEAETAPITIPEELPAEESPKEKSSSNKPTKRRSSKRGKKEDSSKNEKPKRRRSRSADKEND